MDDRGISDLAREFSEEIEQRVGAVESLAPTIGPISQAALAEMAMGLSSIVEVSAPAPIVAGSAQEAVDMAFGELMPRKAADTRSGGKTRQYVKKAVRRAFSDLPKDAVKERASLRTGDYRSAIDFAVHNGKAVQLTQCWSLDTPNLDEVGEKVKAWSWTVGHLRRSGGELAFGSDSIEVPGDLSIYSVVLPGQGMNDAAPSELAAAFEENQVEVLTVDELDKLAASAAAALARP